MKQISLLQLAQAMCMFLLFSFLRSVMLTLKSDGTNSSLHEQILRIPLSSREAAKQVGMQAITHESCGFILGIE